VYPLAYNEPIRTKHHTGRNEMNKQTFKTLPEAQAFYATIEETASFASVASCKDGSYMVSWEVADEVATIIEAGHQTLENAPKIKNGKINGHRLSKIIDGIKNQLMAKGMPELEARSVVIKMMQPYVAGMRK